jgi:hypothetical protein
MTETAEQSENMEKLYRTLRTYVLLEDAYTRFKDKVLPWRTYTDYQSVLNSWDELWENPEAFADGEFEDPETDEELIFRMGVCFGIDYERAYPTGEQEEWPVDLEER